MKCIECDGLKIIESNDLRDYEPLVPTDDLSYYLSTIVLYDVFYGEDAVWLEFGSFSHTFVEFIGEFETRFDMEICPYCEGTGIEE